MAQGVWKRLNWIAILMDAAPVYSTLSHAFFLACSLFPAPLHCGNVDSGVQNADHVGLRNRSLVNRSLP